MTTALYRISGGEVLKISLTDQPFGDADTDYFGVLTDPTLPDGSEFVDPDGDLRVLGYAKFADVGANSVRNATQVEINAFIAAEASDDSSMDTDRAKALAEIDPIFRKVFKALLARIIAEFNSTNNKVNVLGTQFEQWKLDGKNATSLGQMRSSLSALPIITYNLNDSVTLQQAVNALRNDITSDK